MQPEHLIVFAHSRPFERFRIFIADGRSIDVEHPENVLVGTHGLGLWLFHSEGQVEALAGETITGLQTLDPVDPHTFIPETPES